jgi:HPt (histidine-containing phosphotransfer) domain-containing protein
MMVNRLIISFLNRAPRYLTALLDAVTAADAAAVEEQAHSFRGAAGSAGAGAAAEICQRLEALGRTGQLGPNAPTDLHHLWAEIKIVDLHLRANLRQHQTAPR